MSALLVALLAPLVLPPTSASAIRVDAFFDEWADRPTWTPLPMSGPPLDGPGDCAARIQLAWTPERLYFAAQVVDDKFQYGDGVQGDRLGFTWGDHHLEIVLNDLEDRPPVARIDQKPIKGAKLVGTYRKDGWAVEGSIPWGALPDLRGRPVALAAIVHDADLERATQTILASTAIDDRLRAKATTLEMGQSAGLYDRYREEQQDGPPLTRLQGNLAGTKGLAEEVVISEKAIVVLGHGLPGGVGYTFATHGWRNGIELVEAKLINADRTGPMELWVVHKEWAVPDQTRIEVVEIWGIRDGQLRALFAHKTGEWMPRRQRAAQSKIAWKGTRILVHPAKVEGFNEGNWRDIDPPDMPFFPLILPWQRKKPAIYQLEGGAWQPK